QDLGVARRVFRLKPHTGRKRLAEPHDTRAGHTATTAMRGQLGQRSAPVGPVRSALQAAQPPDIAVQLENAATARAVVQAVYVLRNQGKVRLLTLELDQG